MPMRLNPGAVHIHFFSLKLEAMLDQAEQLLAHNERARASRFTHQTVKTRYIAGRCTLRRIIAQYLEIDPKDLVLAEGEQGKPFLADAGLHQRLRFNLTHKHDRAALAISGGFEVGLDLEELRESIPYRRMAERFFYRQETEELLALPDEEQLAAFYRCWTRKEAYLKGLGTGLTRPANSFRVSLLPGLPPVLDDFLSPDLGQRWGLHEVKVPEGYSAALAIEGELTDLICFPWH